VVNSWSQANASSPKPMVAYGSDHLRRQRKDNPQTPQIDPDLDDSPMGLQDCPVLILAVSGVEIQGGMSGGCGNRRPSRQIPPSWARTSIRLTNIEKGTSPGSRVNQSRVVVPEETAALPLMGRACGQSGRTFLSGQEPVISNFAVTLQDHQLN